MILKRGYRLCLVTLAALGLAALCVVFVLRRNAALQPRDIQPGRIESLRQMSSMCTLQMREEMTMRDSIDGKWIVARVKVDGTVEFDLSKLYTERRGDTLTIWLPHEQVLVREDAGPGAYEVLDAWDSKRTLLPRTLSAGEENRLKMRWRGDIERRVRAEGLVDRARDNALQTVGGVASAWAGQYGLPPVVLVRGEWE